MRAAEEGANISAMEDRRQALALRIERHWFRFGRETPLPGLLLNRAEAPTGVVHTAYRPSLCVVAQGAKASALGERTHVYRAGQCLLASVRVPSQHLSHKLYYVKS